MEITWIVHVIIWFRKTLFLSFQITSRKEDEEDEEEEPHTSADPDYVCWVPPPGKWFDMRAGFAL